MKIALLEPLNVEKELIDQLAQPIKDMGHEFVYYDEKTTDKSELNERSKDADIVMIANNPYPKEAFEDTENLEYINVAFTGIDHVDTDTASSKGIKVSNSAGYADKAVAELVIGLTLDLFRKITESDADTRKAEDFGGPIKGLEISGKTVGIIGVGNIGIATAQLFKAFGANVIGYNRSESKEGRKVLDYVSLDELLEKSDIVSVHLPSTDDTKNFLGKAEFAKMKESALLINAARGPIIDNEELAKALNAEVIAGAGIDVFDMEPPIPSDYPLLQAKHTVLTPHIAFLTNEAMERRAHIVFDNAISYLKGEPKNILVD